jgi:uncharacterized surface protein with fasciclin (FAS1) repeats
LKDKALLTKILTYHVVPGAISASDLSSQSVFKTAQGQEVTVRYVGNVLYINDAIVTMYNIKSTNGIIQVIDTVLMPK